MKALTTVTDSLFGFVITKNYIWKYTGFWFIFPGFIACTRNLFHGIAPIWVGRIYRPYRGLHRMPRNRTFWDSMPLRRELQERARDNAKVLDSLALKGELTIYGI